MVSITGYLLEYPIIYTTHLATDEPNDELDEWEQRTNCLSIVHLIQVYLADYMLYSFSLPVNLIDYNNSDDELLKLKINHRLDDLDNKINWLKDIRCEIRREQIKLDRFAL
jgi:hypothetical protein